MTDPIEQADKEFKEALERIKTEKLNSEKYWRAIVDRDRAAYRGNRLKLARKIRELQDNHEKDLNTLLKLVINTPINELKEKAESELLEMLERLYNS